MHGLGVQKILNSWVIVAVGEGPGASCHNNWKGPEPAVKGAYPSEEGKVPESYEGAGEDTRPFHMTATVLATKSVSRRLRAR